ncbi:MAG TPA: M23 family metallopeptidase [Terracidiphilus sp.]|nr:M23 family metallopeptidase [Terracidiphilus sp.]
MPELLRSTLAWAALVAPGFLVVSVLAPVGFAFRRRRWALIALLLIALEWIAKQFDAQMFAGIAGLAIDAGSVVFLARGLQQSWRMHAAWGKRLRGETPVMLEPPFEGRWKAQGTGPWAAWNHHLAASDQWFATDWLRVDGESRGSRVLSPVNGVVATVEEGRPDKPARRWVQRDIANPAGNYVSVRVDGREHAYVILAHLEMGSITVWPGKAVHVGEVIGRCGNSGNTTRPHLHVHAQQAARVAPGSMWGIPILFGGRTEWTRGGEVLEGAKAAADEVKA